ncbi:unnamed protein product [Didymodactylos carnosus]|uniref:Protein fem-1 homolog B n=1 Tax=Didymodactylos carnosus TaxID=1234261 RepID=A0A815ID08_9BILA|nr:unnamed protein product [Didymodactylos carnosus]CAF1363798.1 unnamed protein product [Didymodactylos carnosus]CAF3702924.1 unnamed protein product [Didymodactylos carnosus]CAF4244483.1 unnamed protein product [Didymodactylos carnosus]
MTTFQLHEQLKAIKNNQSPLTDVRLFSVEVYTLIYDNNRYQYEGQLKNGLRHGEGRCIYRRSECIEWIGQWIDNMWHLGTVKWKSNVIDSGRWTGDNAKGSFNSNSGYSFHGEWVDPAILHGQGIDIQSDGTRYEGMFRYGYKCGYGEVTYADGSQYGGIWHAGKLCIKQLDMTELLTMMKQQTNEMRKSTLFSNTLHLIKTLKYFVHGQITHYTHYTEESYMLKMFLETIVDEVLPEYVNIFINDFVPYTKKYQWNILIIAARNGYYKVVKRLLQKFNVNIEIEASVDYDGLLVEGASPLWCAAASGYMNIVKLLMDHGAQVNHLTRNHSTPLMAACFDGNFDIVKYLVENGAILDIKNISHGHSSLMLASYTGCVAAVDYLLKKGANVNLIDKNGNGAVSVKHSAGLTPLMTAAIQSYSSIVDYLAESSATVESIEAYKLLATTYCNKSSEDLVKNVPSSIEAYQNHVECQTLQDVEKIRHNADALHMQCLIIQERILGIKSDTLYNSIRYSGAVYAAEKKYDRCILLWMRSNELLKGVNKCLGYDLKLFAQLLGEMIFNNVEVATKLLEYIVINCKQQLITVKMVSNDHNSNIHALLYMCTLIVKVTS